MRVNIYSQELTDETELGLQQSNTGTFWLPKSINRREELATTFEELAQMVRQAPLETGLD